MSDLNRHIRRYQILSLARLPLRQSGINAMCCEQAVISKYSTGAFFRLAYLGNFSYPLVDGLITSYTIQRYYPVPDKVATLICAPRRDRTYHAEATILQTAVPP